MLNQSRIVGGGIGMVGGGMNPSNSRIISTGVNRGLVSGSRIVSNQPMNVP
jgi:hypothetical protein